MLRFRIQFLIKALPNGLLIGNHRLLTFESLIWREYELIYSRGLLINNVLYSVSRSETSQKIKISCKRSCCFVCVKLNIQELDVSLCTVMFLWLVRKPNIILVWIGGDITVSYLSSGTSFWRFPTICRFGLIVRVILNLHSSRRDST